MSDQPQYKYLTNLGDASPLDYGGYFVFVFNLDRCTYVNGILSDNKYHPEHPAWFAKPESEKKDRPQDTTYLSNICSVQGISKEELIRLFTSADPVERAEAYRCVLQTHGPHNLDEYPLELTRKEGHERYSQYRKRP